MEKKIDPFVFMLSFVGSVFVLFLILLITISQVQNNQNQKEEELLEKQAVLKVEDIREESKKSYVCNAVHYLKIYHFKIAGHWLRTSLYTNKYDQRKVAEIEVGSYVRYTATADGDIIRIKKIR